MQLRQFVALAITLAGCGGVQQQVVVDEDFGVPFEKWSWLDVPGMVCGNGSPTGIAINPSKRSDKLLLVIEGGGGCWDPATCYGILIPVTASHLDGFNAQTFENDIRPLFDQSWLVQRSDATSPFGDATWVFVPYCTGDLHAGTQTTVYEALGQTRTMHHMGAHNMDAVLERIAPYPINEVFTVGFSAGGYGAQLNWDRIAAVYPNAKTHIFADGAQLVQPEAGRWSMMNQRWAPRYPKGCTNCSDRLDNVAAYWRMGAPPNGGRYGLTASLEDEVLTVFMGYDAQGMHNATLPIGNAMMGDQAAFIVDTKTHTLLGTPTVKTSTNVELRAWTEAWVTGDAAFKTVGP